MIPSMLSELEISKWFADRFNILYYFCVYKLYNLKDELLF